jgi:hypothetical protein
MVASVVLEASRSRGIRLKVELSVFALNWLWDWFR